MKKREPLNPNRIQIVTQLTYDLWICLAHLRENMGHDDSLPYQADIYLMDKKATPGRKKINFVKVGEIWNDGWGGDSTLHSLNDEAIQRFRDECAKHQVYWNGKPYGPYDLETLCDEMAAIWVDVSNASPDDHDYTYVYMMDDCPSIKAYGGQQDLKFTTRKFSTED